MVSKHKFNVRPLELPGRNWYLIAVRTEHDADTGAIEEDIWISGELDDFVKEYESGERTFGPVSIVDGAEVSVNGTPIRSVGPESVPHVPERCTVVDGNSGEVDVWVTAGYGPVPEGPEIALLARHTPLGRPDVTIQFWAPRAVAEF